MGLILSAVSSCGGAAAETASAPADNTFLIDGLAYADDAACDRLGGMILGNPDPDWKGFPVLVHLVDRGDPELMFSAALTLTLPDFSASLEGKELKTAYIFFFLCIKFKVTEDNVTSLTVRWVGTGYDLIMDCSDMAVYIYNAGRWESAGRISYDGIDYELRTIKKTFSTAGRGYIDTNGMVHMMVEGPDGYLLSMLETDYIDDPARPGAVLGPKTVPRKTKEALRNGVPEEVFFALSFDGHVPQGVVVFHEGFRRVVNPNVRRQQNSTDSLALLCSDSDFQTRQFE
jgi:hypothetical protein